MDKRQPAHPRSRLRKQHFIDRNITPDTLGTFGGSGIPTIAEDHDGRVLTQTSEGIARWSGDHSQLFDRTNGLDFSDISNILTDQNGSLWFSSRGHGLRLWLGYNEVENRTVSQGPSNDIVWTIFRDRQKHLWLGDETQISQLDESRSRIFPSKNLSSTLFQKTDGITECSDGSVSVNLYGQLLHSNPSTHRFTQIAKLPTIARLFNDSSHRIWLLSRVGLYVIKDQVSAPHPRKSPIRSPPPTASQTPPKLPTEHSGSSPTTICIVNQPRNHQR